MSDRNELGSRVMVGLLQQEVNLGSITPANKALNCCTAGNTCIMYTCLNCVVIVITLLFVNFRVSTQPFPRSFLLIVRLRLHFIRTSCYGSKLWIKVLGSEYSFVVDASSSQMILPNSPASYLGSSGFQSGPEDRHTLPNVSMIFVSLAIS